MSLPVRIRPAIVLFGDSITQQGFGWTGAAAGWASLLARDYSRRADVLNRGFSGYSTRMALDLLPGIFPGAGAGAGAGAPDVTRGEVLFATVFFGANDAALPGERQHVPPEEYARNLRLIVDHVRGSGTPGRTAPGEGEGEGGGGGGGGGGGCPASVPVILFTPPPVDADAWYAARGEPEDKERANDRANDNSRMYGDLVKEVGRETDCPVLDVFDLLGGNGPVEEFGKHLRDGLHLSESGNVLAYEGLMDLIGRELPHLLPMTDGQGRYGKSGVALEEKLWGELC